MASGTNQPFGQSGIVTLAASTTSAGAALPASNDTILVSNPTTSLAWIALGGGVTPPTAVAGAGYPVLPGQRRLIASGTTVTQVAAILATGTGSVIVEVGTGSAT
jgi:hypothetical protein